jgi:LmbE family N-acetylglucosaminyl deacetylase
LFRDRGNPIRVAVLTSGASGVEDGFSSPPTRARKAEIREDEQRRSCRFFGLEDAELSFLRLSEDEKGHPIENGDSMDRVQACLTECEPDLVFLPHGNDTNAGHRRSYSMFRTVAETGDFEGAAFLIQDPKTIDLRRDAYTLFGEREAEWKARLLRFHESQQQRNMNTRGHGFDDRILDLNREIAWRYLDSELYAETFEIEFFLREEGSTS